MKNDWFEIWFEDKKEIISIMLKNMASDLDAGYDPLGKSIRQQRIDIENYQRKFDNEMILLRDMEPNRIQHWCYMDLKRRGAIS